jgi:hypothetical protein
MAVKLGDKSQKVDTHARKMYDLVQDQEMKTGIMLKEVKTGTTIMRKYNKSLAAQELEGT